MDLENISSWEDIRKILKKNFKHVEGCIDFFPKKNCILCTEYQELVGYQQEIANTKYIELSPMARWEKSFKDTIKYLKAQIKTK